MKKILPINKNLFFKGYTHHAFRNAIISSPEKVHEDEKDSIAEIEVNNFQNFSWQKIIQDISYTINNDSLVFYSHPYSQNQNAFFAKKCNKSDEKISLTINKQMYTNYYVSVHIFLIP